MKSILLFLVIMIHIAGQAQPAGATPPKLVLTREDSLAMKVFSVRFGPYKAGTQPLADDLKKLAGTELVITDSSGLKWQAVSFRFGWRRRDVSDDPRTGKRKAVYVFNAVEVTGSRLPAEWQQELGEYVLPTEELWFEEILVQHPKTKKMMRAAPMVLKVM